MSLFRGVRGALLLSLLLGAAAFLALGLYADIPQMMRSLIDFRWGWYLPAILGLSLLSYLLRFLKWHFYLNLLEIRISRRDSLGIFLSGLSMVVTPWRVGEWIKSYMLARVSPVPVSLSAPIVLAERLTDALALAMLASLGLLAFGRGWEVIALTLVLMGLALALSQYRPLALWGIKGVRRLPYFRSRTQALFNFYRSSHTLFSPVSLTVALALGLASWGAGCLSFYLVVRGLGWPMGGLVEATFIFSASNLAGALLSTPGGMGVTEGGMVGLSAWLLGMGRGLSGTATLLTRAVTLWFGVALGVVGLLITLRRLGTSAKSLEQD